MPEDDAAGGTADVRDALSLEPPEELFDGEDVDTGDAPGDDDLTDEEVDDVVGQAGDAIERKDLN